MGLLVTLALGFFILLGAGIVFLMKNNDKFIQFSISLAFGVILMLITIDLLPEAYETIDSGNYIYNFLYIFLGAGSGFLFLKILDYFVPDHEDNHNTTLDDDKNLKHIGLVSSIALVIHNIVEGMAIYLLVTSDIKAGLLACIGVGLHNIPLGMVITSTFYKANNNKRKTLFIILGISLSTFIGGFFIYLFHLSNVIKLLESVSIVLTIGMLIYILLMELLPKIIYTKEKKITAIGILLGIMLLIITLFI